MAFLPLFLLFQTPSFADEPLKIVVVESDSNRIYQEIVKGISEKSPPIIKRFNLKEDQNIAQELHKIHPDVFIAVGNDAADWTMDRYPKKQIVTSGVISQSTAKDYSGVAGVFMDCPAESYIELTKAILPSTKKIGVLYNPDRSSAFIDKLTASAKSAHLELNARPIFKENDIGTAMADLSKWGFKAFLVTYDPLVMNRESWKYLVDYSLRNDVALVVPSMALLKSGGVLAEEVQYVDVGRQTAFLINQLYQNAQSLDHVSAFPTGPEVGINMRLMSLLGLSIPADERHRITRFVEN